MKEVQKKGINFFVAFGLFLGMFTVLNASECSTKLFSVTVDSKPKHRRRD